MNDLVPTRLPWSARASTAGEVRRVLMTASGDGEVWSYTRELSRALGARGVEVTLACLGTPLSAAHWAEVRRIPGLSVEQSTWPLEGSAPGWEGVDAAGEWLLELEARLRPDAIHLNGYSHGALPFERRPLVVGHDCFLARWEALQGEPALERDVRERWAVTRGLRGAGHVVASSGALLESLERHYGPLPPASVIPFGRRCEDFSTGFVREPFVLATGALWDEAANLQVLETVSPWLSWPILVAGGEPHPEGGEVRARHVRSLGRLSPEQLTETLGRASIYVLPARHEPSGQRVLEAALSGCALVLGDIPALREHWEDAAVFVHPEDTEMLGRALRRLVTEPVLRSRMATLARTRALEFTSERMAESYLHVYASLSQEESWAQRRYTST